MLVLITDVLSVFVIWYPYASPGPTTFRILCPNQSGCRWSPVCTASRRHGKFGFPAFLRPQKTRVHHRGVGAEGWLAGAMGQAHAAMAHYLGTALQQRS